MYVCVCDIERERAVLIYCFVEMTCVFVRTIFVALFHCENEEEKEEKAFKTICMKRDKYEINRILRALDVHL